MENDTVEKKMKRLEDAVAKARELSVGTPGKYGGLYVAQKSFGDYVILSYDDPDRLKERDDLDLVAHVSPTYVTPIGRTRYYLNNDGTTNLNYFKE